MLRSDRKLYPILCGQTYIALKGHKPRESVKPQIRDFGKNIFRTSHEVINQRCNTTGQHWRSNTILSSSQQGILLQTLKPPIFRSFLIKYTMFQINTYRENWMQRVVLIGTPIRKELQNCWSIAQYKAKKRLKRTTELLRRSLLMTN